MTLRSLRNAKDCLKQDMNVFTSDLAMQCTITFQCQDINLHSKKDLEVTSHLQKLLAKFFTKRSYFIIIFVKNSTAKQSFLILIKS